jgi:Holliday junction DNA helicase RuvA
MIATLRGRVAGKGKDYLVVEVGGVGLKVYVPAPLLDRSDTGGREVQLYTHLHVRENELTLYGCASREELELFETLLTVSGIGPKVALGILSHVSVETLHHAVARQEPELLGRIPGIGPRTAQKLIFHLKDKVGVGLAPIPVLSEEDAEVVAALTALGYSISEAQAALRALPERDLPVEEKIRAALSSLARM